MSRPSERGSATRAAAGISAQSAKGYTWRMSGAEDLLIRAVEAFRGANACDPHVVDGPDGPRPRELVDAERLAAWVEKLEPEASLALRLASHCQHLRRWKLPRSEYEPGRLGYLKWRKALARFHADQAGEILRGLGCPEEVLLAVRRINLKQDMQGDPDVQSMEDALCLSFLEHELADFARLHPDDKVVDIIAKTWRKMSDRAHSLALGLPFTEHALRLVQAALAA